MSETINNTSTGKYIAEVHYYLKLVKSTFKKGHEKDLNHNDKQNFEAVQRITSQSTVSLLKQLPQLGRPPIDYVMEVLMVVGVV